MEAKIVRADGTELQNIKSCTFSETVNAETDLRPGCVSAAMIDVEFYGGQSSAPYSGEKLEYYQVDMDGNETLIGLFYAEPSIASRFTVKFAAYDAVSKLDIGFSSRLSEIQSSFPMSVYALVSEACSVAGVTLATSTWPMSTQSVQSFYADGLTCRNILQYAAEIAGRYVRANLAGNIVFDWYEMLDGYRVWPTIGSDGEETYVPYRQDGLTYENYNVKRVGSVAVMPIDTEGAAYIYPSTIERVTVIDNGGAVTIRNINATADNGAVEVSGAIDVYGNGDGDVTVEAQTDNNNSLVISNNILLTSASSTVMNAIAENIYNVMRALPTYRPARISMFPDETPLRAGQFVHVTDIQGVSFTTPVMRFTISQTMATAESTGNESYETDYGTSVKNALANLSNAIVQIDRLKVNWAEIQTAVINSLIATGIDASQINVTNLDADNIMSGLLKAALIALYGYMEVYEDSTLQTVGGKMGYATGSNSFGGGIAIEAMEPDVWGHPYGGVVVAGKNSVFLGYRAANAPWLDGGVDVFEDNFTARVYLKQGGLVCDVGALIVNGREVLSEIDALTPTVIQSNTVAFITNQIIVETSFSAYTYVDLYFTAQGVHLPAQRIRPNKAEGTYSVNLEYVNPNDDVLRRFILTFTTAGRYLSALSIRYSYNNDAYSTISPSNSAVYLEYALGY